ncbi:hypothetical protein FJQ54_04180 [Sandaracinobacter neustonicus]|uniref:Right handed beta helix domain-containing protein n=1 Tax=Sandaracinobacter neustonicus TaxID=1715348 RepID=A0A501XRY1_9SPHN|nr:hypothetical protein [Sandaracinobacter neustonicus]TPE63320.1 hypothetical protein FJQ54_04180 [Sandaracinobacter neustonicus]
MFISAVRPVLHVALVAAALAAPAAAEARTFNAANRADLWNALTAATAGDTILLAPGHYGDFSFTKFKYSGGFVSIRSADASNRAAFGKMTLGTATGLSISGIDAQSSANPVVSITGQNIRFTGNRIRGANINRDPWDDGQGGMHVRFASNILVGSNDFEDLRVAIYVQRSTNVRVLHNSIGYVREGLNVAALAGGEIANNHFHNFQPNYSLGEHPDAIQFWTRQETVGVTDVKIRNNFMQLGLNGAVHGLFVGSEAPNVYHRNLEITGNVYWGSALHGITLAGTIGARLFNNVIVASHWADKNNSSLRTPDGRTGGAMQPQIRVSTVSQVEVARNITMKGIGVSEDSTWADNIDLYDTERKIGESWESVFGGRPTEKDPPLSAFLTLNPSSARTRGIGLLSTFSYGVVTLDPVKAENWGAAQDATTPATILKAISGNLPAAVRAVTN